MAEVIRELDAEAAGVRQPEIVVLEFRAPVFASRKLSIPRDWHWLEELWFSIHGGFVGLEIQRRDIDLKVLKLGRREVYILRKGMQLANYSLKRAEIVLLSLKDRAILGKHICRC